MDGKDVEEGAEPLVEVLVTGEEVDGKILAEEGDEDNEEDKVFQNQQEEF